MTTKISTDNIQAGALATLGSAVPKISAIAYVGNDTAADIAGGQTITLTGTGFAAGARVLIDGVAVGVVSVVNSTTITLTAPAKSAGTYVIYVINSDGGTAILLPGVSYSGVPTWSNAAGSLGSLYEGAAVSTTLVATGDAPVTYSLYSGTLPAGVTLSNVGVLSGTAPADTGSTTYTFTIRATDAQNQDTDRSFSLTINTDTVTWSAPADNTSYAVYQNAAISNVSLAASSAGGRTITYTANTLPTGISVSGNVIYGTPTTLGNTTTLLTATSTSTRSATRTISWSVSVGSDTGWKYTTLLLTGETAANVFVADSSTNNFAVTISGDTKPSYFNPYTPGYYSVYLDGVGDYVDASTATTIGTGDFTAECWAWIPSTQVDAYTCFITSAASSGGSIGIVMRKTTWWIGTGSSGDSVNINPSSYYVYSQWMHVAMTRSGSTVRAFINGALAGSMSNSDNIASTQFRFGCNYTDTTAYGLLTGYISNARIVAGTALYTAAFTPSTSPFTAVSGTQLLTLNSNRFVDTSGNNRTVTKVGDTLIKSANPFVPNSSYATYGSGYFDGTGDYLTVPSSANLAFGTGDFTVEFWIYPTASFAAYVKVITGGSAGTFSVETQASDNKLWVTNYSSTILASSTALTLNAWNHFAVVRSGTTLTLYLNGTSVGTTTNSTNWPQTSFYIGGNAGTSNITGYVADLRFVKGTAVYTTAFTPTTAPLTAVTNTQLLTLQTWVPHNNSIFVDSSGFDNPITRYGNSTNGTFSPYGNNWSNYFDGTGDYISFPSSANYTLGTTGTDFTVECWIFPTAAFSASGAATYIMTSQSDYNSGYTNRWGLVGQGNTILWFDATGNYAITSTTLTVINVWSHIAVVRNGSTITMYVNGTSVGSTSSTLAYTTQSGVLIGGIPNGNYFTGYISNARVIKGTALYTSAFTPGTTPLTAVTNTQLLTCQNNRLIDNSPNGATATKNGDVAVQKFSPFNNYTVTPTSYSNYFDGTGDYLVIADSTAFTIGTNNFTIEAWICPLATPSSNSIALISSQYIDGGSRAFMFAMYNNAGTMQLLFQPYSSSTATIISQNCTFNLGEWIHVAAVRSSNNVTLYRNGVSLGTTAYSSSIDNASGAYLIGARYNASSVAELFFNGYISNYRFTNGQALYTTTFTPATSPLTTTSQSATAANVSLLTCQSTTFIDNSTNAFTITANGDTKPMTLNPFGYTTSTAPVSWDPTVFGASTYFDGTGDYLTIADSPSSEPGSNNFTLECWYYMNAANGYLIGKRNSQSSNYGIFQITVSETGGSVIGVLQGGSPWDLSLNFTATTPLKTWNHMAFVRSGNVYTVYINGVSSGTTTLSGALNNSNYDWVVGAYQSDGTGAFSGYISNMRFVIGTAVYTSNFVPPAAPTTAIKNTVLLLDNRPAVVDYSMNNNLETVGDAKIVSSTRKYGYNSLYFDGTGDYLSIPSSSALNFGTGNFTIECWVYFNSFSNIPFIFNKIAATSGWFVEVSASILYFGYGSASSSQYWQASVTLVTGVWYHIAVTRVGAVLSAYVNGAKQSGTLSGADSSYDNAAALTIGSYSPTSASYDLNGYISDFRVTRGLARYTANFTPSTVLIK